MKDLKLRIELIPKGAWGNNLRAALPKKDWDTLREICYKKSNHKCDICGYATDELDAHEVWNFNIANKTQTLKDIISLCSKCHGVKHMRNSERLGYGDNAKRHFMRVNSCDEMTLASHVFEAQMLYDEQNEVYRWKIKADLNKFGGKGMEIKQRKIPFIESPYESVDFKNLMFTKANALFIFKENKEGLGTPSVESITTNNYEGTIKITSHYANKIDWSLDGELIKTKYNVSGKFTTTFKVENLEGSTLKFRLTGDGGETYSQVFKLKGENL